MARTDNSNTNMVSAPEIHQLLTHAITGSRFLQRELDARAWLPTALARFYPQAFDKQMMQNFLASRLSEATSPETAASEDQQVNSARALRQLRALCLSLLVVRDLNGLAPLSEVMMTMTQLAEVSLAHCLQIGTVRLEQRYGVPRNNVGERQELLIIGMGKLGGRELNVSSDIDLVFVFPEAGDTDGKQSISNFEYFTKLGQIIIALLDESSEYGRVFRVDMRLRPNGDSGALVSSLASLETYFVSQGRDWERYAWIKARVLSPPQNKLFKREIIQIVQSFIFRKYLDYSAFESMRALHAQIRREVSRRDLHDNIKLGPGGIREIEFIAQVFQIIRGGREKDLRIRPTLSVLTQLERLGILSTPDATQLADAYQFLRRLEHRLQYFDDRQTHDIPTNEADRKQIALNMGYSSWPGCATVLQQHRQFVSQQFSAIFADPSESEHPLTAAWLSGNCDGELNHALHQLPFQDPEAAAARLCQLRESPRYKSLDNNIYRRLDAIIPRIIEASAKVEHADRVLFFMADFIETIIRRSSYLSLLQQYPDALNNITELANLSRWAAQYLLQHPILLDELLDHRQQQSLPDCIQYEHELRKELAEFEADTERQMDSMREHFHAQVFRLLIHDVRDEIGVQRLADELAALADINLQITLELCWRKLKSAHQDSPAFAIIGYGKLGGKELGYSSDLDLVFLFEDEADEAMTNYAKLGQRISTWLSSQTPAGQLYEVDLRLRPNGEAGLIVNNMNAFDKYQRSSAWVWEHQALSRARFCAGDSTLQPRFDEIRKSILCLPRDSEQTRAEILAMRKKLFYAHGNKSNGFELKHDYGGLVDVEFIIQYLILTQAAKHEWLTNNLGNITLLKKSGKHNLIPEAQANNCADSYRDLRRLQHRARLEHGDSVVSADKVASIAASVKTLWQTVFGTHPSA